MTGSSAEKSTRPKGSPVVIILLAVILAPAILLGSLAGAGGAAIIGGFVAMFSLLTCMGGSLSADLRRLLVIGPLLAFGAVVPRLLAEYSLAAAFALMTLVIFVGGLLPLRSHRYDTLALGLGMSTLLGYSLPIAGGVQAGQLVIAGLVGILLAVVLRLVAGVRDPNGPTRKAVADLLDGEHADFATAFDAWLSGGRPRWLGTVLVAAGRYRLARRTLSSPAVGGAAAEESLASMSERASAVAEAIRARSAPDTASDEDESDPPHASPASPAWATANDALDDADAASRTRDGTQVPIPSGFRRRVSLGAVRAGLRNGSIQVRHATRTALAVLLALLVSLFLPASDPLLPTLLATTFAIVQLSWRATLARTRDRLLGLLAGGVIVVIVLLLLPPALLIPVSIVGLIVGLWFITARPAIGVAGILVMSVGLNSEMRQLDPISVALEYVILGLIALLIGGVIGFVVIPAWRPGPMATRIDTAVTTSAAALRALAEGTSVEPAEQVFRKLADAEAAAQQLVPDHENLTDDQARALEQLRRSLGDLLATALLGVAGTSPDERGDLRVAASILEGGASAEAAGPIPDPAPTLSAVLPLLASEVIGRRDEFAADGS